MAGNEDQLQSPEVMRRIVLTLLVLLAGLWGSATAVDQDLGALLTSRFRDQILALRHASAARSQEYDFQGNPTAGGREGPWTVYGRMVVQKVSVTVERVEVEGKRVLFESRGQSGALSPVPQSENLRIAIRFNHPLNSEDEAVAVIGRVFALTPQEIVESSPTLWQRYLAKHLGVAQSRATAQETRGGAQEGSESNVTQVNIATDLASAPKVLRLEGGTEIAAPKPRHTPSPKYSDLGRKRLLEGVVSLDLVLDNTGTVRNLEIIHPLGLGLDEAAADTVSKWKFTPAMRDGRPVACAFHIDVDFRLYDHR
jgi:TonB family protein